MAARKTKFWYQMPDDFMDQALIKLILKQDNGKDYILLLISLMCKATHREGFFRIDDELDIPITDKSISVIVDEDLDTVRVFSDMFLFFLTKCHAEAR